jgi:hypothetical protein
LNTGLDKLNGRLANASARPAYHWDDKSPLARLPKNALANARGLEAVQNRRGQLSDAIKEGLQMTGEEAAQTQAAVTRFLSTYEALEARNMKQVAPNADDLQGHSPDETRVFDVPYIGSDQMTGLRQDFFGQVTAILGDERSGLFTNALGFWMPVTEGFVGISSGQAVFNSSFRAQFYQPNPGSSRIQYAVTTYAPNHSSMSAQVPSEEVPQLFVPYLQDWLASMQDPAP